MTTVKDLGEFQLDVKLICSEPHSYKKFTDIYNSIKRIADKNDGPSNCLVQIYVAIMHYFSLGVNNEVEIVKKYLGRALKHKHDFAVGLAIYLSHMEMYDEYQYLAGMKNPTMDDLIKKARGPLEKFFSENSWESFCLCFIGTVEALKFSAEMGNPIGRFALARRSGNIDELEVLWKSEIIYAIDYLILYYAGNKERDPMLLIHDSLRINKACNMNYALYLMGRLSKQSQRVRYERMNLGIKYLLESDNTFYPNVVQILHFAYIEQEVSVDKFHTIVDCLEKDTYGYFVDYRKTITNICESVLKHVKVNKEIISQAKELTEFVKKK